MNLALFPITALLLLLSGVGAPARPADNRLAANRLAATALMKAILGNKAMLGNVGERSTPRRRSNFSLNPPGRQHVRTGWGITRTAIDTNVRQLQLATRLNLRQDRNRKAYRARFGFVEGAYQPQGPPRLHARA